MEYFNFKEDFKMSEIEKKKKDSLQDVSKEQSNVQDEAIAESASNPENTTVSDEQVAEARAQSGEAKADAQAKAGESVDAANDSEKSGASGQEIKKQVRRGIGHVKPQISKTIVAFSSAKSMVSNPDLSKFSDLDQLERNSSLAEDAASKIPANIVREATKGTEGGQHAIIGNPGDATVYSKESTTSAEIVTGKTSYLKPDNPKHRANGSVLSRQVRNQPTVLDHVYASVNDLTGEREIYSHDAVKEIDSRNNLLLNRRTRSGTVKISNTGKTLDDNNNVTDNTTKVSEFIMPKRGVFHIVGFNPLKTEDHLKNIGYVKRVVDGVTIMQPVFQATTGASVNPFKVIDMTPTIEDISTTVDNVKQWLVANKGKMKLGEYERASELLANAVRSVTDPIDVIKWPEYANVNRSSLTSVVGLGSPTYDISCRNDMEQFVELMRAFESSEIINLAARANTRNLKDNLKAFRNFEGVDPTYPYFNNVFKGNVDNDYKGSNSYKTAPTIAAYAASKANPIKFRTMPKWLYTFRTFWSDLETYAKQMDGSIKDEIFSKVTLATEVIDNIINGLAIGHLADPESVTSSEVLSNSDIFNVLLPFDPNDFIGVDSNGYFPSSCYVNSWTRDESTYAINTIYDVIPSWLQILCEASSSRVFRSRLIENIYGHAPTPQVELKTYFDSGKYANIRIDTIEPTWFSFYYLEAFSTFSKQIFSNKNATSAFFRWLEAKEVFSLMDAFEDSISLSDAMSKLLENEVLFMKSNANKPGDYPRLYPEAIQFKFDEYFKNQIASGTKGINIKGHTGYAPLIFKPEVIDDYKFDLQNLVINGKTYASITDLMSDISDFVEGGSLKLVMSPDKTSAFLANVEDTEDNNILSLVNVYKTLNEKGTIMSLVDQFGAQNTFKGYEDNPDEYLYKHDTFRNLQPCDTYTIRLYLGEGCEVSREEGSTNINDYLPNIRVGLAPVILIKESDVNKSNSDVVNTTKLDPIAARVRIALFKGQDNQLYTDPTTTRDARFRTTNGITNYTGLNDFPGKHLMCIPSLYGSKRYTIGSYGMPQFLSIAELDAQSNLTCKLTIQNGINHKKFYGFVPNVVEVTLRDFDTDGAEKYTTSELKDLFVTNTTSMSDYLYFEVTKTITHNYDNESMTGLVDTYSSQTRFLARINSLSSPIMILNDIDELEATDFTAEQLTNLILDEVSYEAVLGLDTKYKIGIYGKRLDVANFVAFKDYFMRHYDELLRTPFDLPIAAGFVCDGNDWGRLVFTYPESLMQHPDIMSKNCINDVREFFSDKPVIRLNKDWSLYGYNKCLLEMQYKKNKF
jgi:hypothetical protein